MSDRRVMAGCASKAASSGVKQVARTIKAHLQGILKVIVTTSTSAIAESLTARLRKAQAMTCGFGDRERFRRTGFFHPGGLDHTPAGASCPPTRKPHVPPYFATGLAKPGFACSAGAGAVSAVGGVPDAGAADGAIGKFRPWNA